MRDERFDAWYAELTARHLERLTFQELRRSVQALSRLYVERRERIPSGTALRGSGKRAAQALFFGPLHLLLVRRIVAALGAASPAPRKIADLGCGTGAAGAAWALESSGRPRLAATDRDAWAATEAQWTYRSLGLSGQARVGRMEVTALPGRAGAVVAAFAVNELGDPARAAVLQHLLDAARRGARVLVVEPIARRATPWWDTWAAVFSAVGGRSDDWRFPAELPEGLRLLDRAAGLDHRELTGRSLWLHGHPL